MIKRINFFDGYTSEVTPSAIIPSGRSIFTGTPVPSNSLGNDGDIYLKADGTIYLKTSGAWNVDSTLLVDVITDAQTATTNANNAASQATTDTANAITTLTTSVNNAIADFANISFLKEKLAISTNISANTWITIPNGSTYTLNKISVALNGIVQTQGDDYELSTSTGARSNIKILVPLYPSDLLTFIIYN
jgi:hypothetical protein